MAMEQLDKALAELTDKIAQLGAQHGSEAIHLAGKVFQLNAIGDLVSVIPVIILLPPAAYILYRAIRKLRDETAKPYHDQDEATFAMYFVTMVLSGVSSIGLTAGTLVLGANLFSPLTWAAAFNPNVALAAHILKAL